MHSLSDEKMWPRDQKVDVIKAMPISCTLMILIQVILISSVFTKVLVGVYTEVQ